MRVVISVLVLILAECLNAQDLCAKFKTFKREFEKEYATKEEEHESKQYYKEHCEQIVEHQQLVDMGIMSYELKPMPFIDSNFADVKANKTGLILPVSVRSLPAKKTTYPAAPPDYNWCDLHNPVRDQNTCGACWAFSVVASVEACVARNEGVKRSFSEQMLIDCDPYNQGCNGGWPTAAFQFVNESGLDISEYSYINDQSACLTEQFDNSLEQGSFIKITEEYINGDEEKLKKIIHSKGPTVVAIHINDELLSYSAGVYLNDTCDKEDINHAVVICGYGTDPDYGPFWTVRNSWSSYWGENGYIRMARGRNTCGIATYAIFADYLKKF